MEAVQIGALVIGLASLVAAVLGARTRGGFPLLTLGREWFGERPSRSTLLVGVAAGFASVLTVPVVGHLAGAARIEWTGVVTTAWVGLAVVSVAIKLAFVVFEEVTYRGSLCAWLHRWSPTTIVVGASALVFAAAHADRSAMEIAILWLDGVGFAAAYLTLGNLWMPAAWHLSKNVAVWLIYGAGTVGLTSGPAVVSYRSPGRWLGSSGEAGLGDLVVTCVVVASVLVYLRWRRPAQGTGRQNAGGPGLLAFGSRRPPKRWRRE